MVRKYIDKPLSPDTTGLLNERIARNNEDYDLNLRLVTDNSDEISGIAKLLLTKSVYNYIILAGKSRRGGSSKV